MSGTEFDTLRQKVSKVLKQTEIASLILDLWSSNNMVGYTGVSCSFITQNVDHSSCPMIGSHNTEAILSE